MFTGVTNRSLVPSCLRLGVKSFSVHLLCTYCIRVSGDRYYCSCSRGIISSVGVISSRRQGVKSIIMNTNHAVD